MNFASYFEHTLLRPEMTVDDVKQLCEDAKSAQYISVCIPPYFVADAVAALANSKLIVTTVIGYPFGYSATVAKVEEIKRAIDEGVKELDAVVNLSAIKSGHWDFVKTDMDRMLTACHLKNRKIKFTIEMALLSDKEIQRLCAICNEIEPDFVNIATAFNHDGATVEQITLLRSLLKSSIKIKANIKATHSNNAKQLIDAGADRIGVFSNDF